MPVKPSNKQKSHTESSNNYTLTIENQPDVSPKTLKARNDDDANFLKYNKSPWNEIELRWRRTSRFRSKELAENKDKHLNSFLSDWPLIKHSLGYNLVSFIHSIYNNIFIVTIYLLFR